MLSLIEFETYKLETNQKNVSPFEMQGCFEYIHTHFCLSWFQWKAGTHHSSAAWPTGWAGLDGVTPVSAAPPRCAAALHRATDSDAAEG